MKPFPRWLQQTTLNLAIVFLGLFFILGSAEDNPPIITLLGDNPVTVKQGDVYVDAGATAEDTEDGVVKVVITGLDTLDTSIAKTYTVTYTATDQDDNKAVAIRDVIVKGTDKKSPFHFENIAIPKTTLLPTEPVYFDFTLSKDKDYNDFERVLLYVYIAENKTTIDPINFSYAINKDLFVNQKKSSNDYVWLKTPKKKGTYYTGICVLKVSTTAVTKEIAKECSNPIKITVSNSITSTKTFPDLVVLNPSVSKNTLNPKGKFTVSYDIKNNDELLQDQSFKEIYISTDATITKDDSQLWSNTIPLIKKGETKKFTSRELIAPDKEGDYWIGACLYLVYGQQRTHDVCSEGVKIAVGKGGVLTGRFIDSAVAGLQFSTPTLSGITTVDGGFLYRIGETVSFGIGGIELGSYKGQPIITPVDLTMDAAFTDHPYVLNRARLIQTLDADANPDNGITITADIRQKAISESLDFSIDSDVFEQKAATFLQSVSSSNKQLVSTQKALAHLNASISSVCHYPQYTGIKNNNPSCTDRKYYTYYRYYVSNLITQDYASIYDLQQSVYDTTTETSLQKRMLYWGDVAKSHIDNAVLTPNKNTNTRLLEGAQRIRNFTVAFSSLMAIVFPNKSTEEIQKLSKSTTDALLNSVECFQTAQKNKALSKKCTDAITKNLSSLGLLSTGKDQKKLLEKLELLSSLIGGIWDIVELTKLEVKNPRAVLLAISRSVENLLTDIHKLTDIDKDELEKMQSSVLYGGINTLINTAQCGRGMDIKKAPADCIDALVGFTNMVFTGAKGLIGAILVDSLNDQHNEITLVKEALLAIVFYGHDRPALLAAYGLAGGGAGIISGGIPVYYDHELEALVKVLAQKKGWTEKKYASLFLGDYELEAVMTKLKSYLTYLNAITKSIYSTLSSEKDKITINKPLSLNLRYFHARKNDKESFSCFAKHSNHEKEQPLVGMVQHENTLSFSFRQAGEKTITCLIQSNKNQLITSTEFSILVTPNLNIVSSPQNPKAIAGDEQITLTWDSVTDAEKYTVYRAEETGITPENYSVYLGGRILINKSSPLRIEGLENGKRYYFIITASQTGVESEASTEVSSVPQKISSGLTKKISSGSKNQFSGYYSKLSSNADKIYYNYYYSNNGGSSGIEDIFLYEKDSNESKKIYINILENKNYKYLSMKDVSDDGRYLLFSVNTDFPFSLNGEEVYSGSLFLYDNSTEITKYIYNGSSKIAKISLDNKSVFFGNLRMFKIYNIDSESISTKKIMGNYTSGILSLDMNYIYTSRYSESGEGTVSEQVFLYNIKTGIEKIISVNSNGISGDDDSSLVSVSNYGRYALITSKAKNI